VFDYINDAHVTGKFNGVLQQVALQWSYIEKDTGQAGLQEWWWAWAEDYFQLVGDNTQGWAVEALQVAAGAYTTARLAGKTLATNNEVVSALSSFQSKITKLNMPAIPVSKTPSS
jgi:chitinase